MAHAAEVSRLTKELVQALSGPRVNGPSTLETRKKEALKTFSNTRTGRTNQFEIFARLEGIVERCLIQNNPDVADALQERHVEIVNRDEKWIPEALHLLLELANRPAEKTSIHYLIPPESDPEAEHLTWEELIKDDPLDNKDGIWDNIDYATESSEPLSTDDDDENIALSSRASSRLSQLDDGTKTGTTGYGDLVATVDVSVLDTVRKSNSWRKDTPHHGSCVSLSERNLLREILFMLDGLPTSLFERDQAGLNVPKVGFSLSHVSHSSLYDTLRSFSHIGDAMDTLRQWCRLEQSEPVFHTSRAAVKARLSEIRGTLSELARKISDPARSTISLLSVHDNISRKTESLVLLAQALNDIKVRNNNQTAEKLMDTLFTITCDRQSIGDSAGFDYFATIFLRLLATHLKPIHTWMWSGETPSVHPFFVHEKCELSNMGDFWEKRYRSTAIKNTDHSSPSVLQPLMRRIFNTGKSARFLEFLEAKTFRASGSDLTNNITYEQMHQVAVADDLEPFAERLAQCLEQWVHDLHTPISRQLRSCLETRCGLNETLDSLEYLFLRRDGSLHDALARELLSHNASDSGDGTKTTMNLTGTLQEIYHDVPCININALTSRILPTSEISTCGWVSPHTRLARFCIGYRLPWAVANIIRPNTITIYQRIHTIMLRVVQAKILLEDLPSPKPYTRSQQKPTKQANSLRQHLLWFANTILDYICGNVVQGLTIEMRLHLSKAEDIDDMISVHQRYIHRLEAGCLLSDRYSTVVKALGAILNLAIEFAVQWPRAGQKNVNVQADNDATTTSAENMLVKFKKLHTFTLAALRNAFGRNMSEGGGGVGSGVAAAEEPDVSILADMLSSLDGG